MAQRVLTVLIGQIMTMVAESDYKSAKPVVYGSIQMPTPDGLIEDGTISRDEMLLGAFANNFKNQLKANKIKTTKAVFCINSKRIGTREEEIPNLSESRIKAYIETNATDYFPIDLDKYQITFKSLEAAKDAERIKIQLYAIPTDLISSYENLSTRLGLNIVAMDYQGNTLTQITKNIKSDKTIATLNINASECIMTVVNQGKVLMQRTVTYGLADAIATIADTLEGDKKGDIVEALNAITQKNFFEINDAPVHKPEVTDAFINAEPKPQTMQGYNSPTGDYKETGKQPDGSFSTTGGYTESGDYTATGAFDGTQGAGESVSYADATEAATPTYTEPVAQTPSYTEPEEIISPLHAQLVSDLSMLCGSLRRLYDFYTSKYSDFPIEHSYVMSLGDDMLGLDEYLSAELGIDILSFKDAGLGKNDKENHFIKVIGAAMDPIDIELEGAQKKGITVGKSSSESGGSFAMPIIVCVIFLIAAVALSGYGFFTLTSAEAERLMVSQQVEALQPAKATYIQYLGTRMKYEDVKALYESSQTKGNRTLDFLEELEQKMPTDAFISTIAAGDESVVISFTAADKRTAAKILLQLRQFNTVFDANTTAIAEDTAADGTGFVTFSVTCQYAPLDYVAENLANDANTPVEDGTANDNNTVEPVEITPVEPVVEDTDVDDNDNTDVDDAASDTSDNQSSTDGAETANDTTPATTETDNNTSTDSDKTDDKTDSTPQTGLSPSFTGNETVMYTTGNVKVRTGPDTVYDVAGFIKADEPLPVISEKNGWYEIRYKGVEGFWVSGAYVRE